MKISSTRREIKNDPWLRDGEIEDLSPANWLHAFDNSFPSVNITEDNECFRIEIIAPGFKKRDFTISIEDNIITITAPVQLSNKINRRLQTGKNDYHGNSFANSFRLPGNTREDLVVAAYKDGILKLYIPKYIPTRKKVQVR